MNKRVSGPLDPLINKMPRKRVSELCAQLDCTRKTIYRYQKGAPIAPLMRLRINLLCFAYGLKPMFPTS